MCALGSFLEQRPRLIAENSDVPTFVNFLVTILQHPSLMVSIPVLYIWTKLLSSPALSKSEIFSPIIGPLLETCTNRLLRYEALPPDTEDITFAFLHEDFDTMPERHAFIGNYRRFCVDVLERIVRKSPFEAVRHLLAQADHVFMTLYYPGQPFSGMLALVIHPHFLLLCCEHLPANRYSIGASRLHNVLTRLCLVTLRSLT